MSNTTLDTPAQVLKDAIDASTLQTCTDGQPCRLTWHHRSAAQELLLTFHQGAPPQCGRYLVTDGEEINSDVWQEEVDGRIRFASHVGKPIGGNVIRRWAKYDNVIAWAYPDIPKVNNV